MLAWVPGGRRWKALGLTTLTRSTRPRSSDPSVWRSLRPTSNPAARGRKTLCRPSYGP